MPANLAITGLAELDRSLRGWDSTVGREIRQAQADARRILAARLMDYPSPPAGSTYTRTEALKRGWGRASPVASQAGALQLVNPVEHATWVQVQATQAHVHQGRWDTVEQVAEEEEDAVRALYEAAYVRAARIAEVGGG